MTEGYLERIIRRAQQPTQVCNFDVSSLDKPKLSSSRSMLNQVKSQMTAIELPGIETIGNDIIQATRQSSIAARETAPLETAHRETDSMKIESSEPLVEEKQTSKNLIQSVSTGENEFSEKAISDGNTLTESDGDSAKPASTVIQSEDLCPGQPKQVEIGGTLRKHDTRPVSEEKFLSLPVQSVYFANQSKTDDQRKTHQQQQSLNQASKEPKNINLEYQNSVDKDSPRAGKSPEKNLDKKSSATSELQIKNVLNPAVYPSATEEAQENTQSRELSRAKALKKVTAGSHSPHRAHSNPLLTSTSSVESSATLSKMALKPNSSMANAPIAPSMHIAQIDVIVEAPAAQPAPSPLPSRKLSLSISANYLRRL